MLRTSLARVWREASAPVRLRPGFFILGAQRCATTSLFTWLKLHPDVPDGLRKELHYFEKPAPPTGSYFARYPIALRGRRRWRAGEATPEYLFFPWAGPRIMAHAPEARFLIVLRDPLARACSHYALARQYGRESLGLNAALRAEPERLRRAGWPTTDPTACDFQTVSWLSYLERGRYAEQLQRWFSLVGHERIMLIRFEDLVADPSQYAGPIQRFLGLSPLLTGHEWPHEHGFHTGERLDPETEAWARAELAPANERLATLTGIRWP
jgi:hypothetical protein